MRRALITALVIPSISLAAWGLRYEGYTDREIQEMRAAVAEFSAGDFISISGARLGCNCEEGPSCTHQAGVMVRDQGKNSEWRLVQVEGRWVISKQQRWQLQYDQLMSEYYAKLKEQKGLPLREFLKSNESRVRSLMAQKPSCPEQAPNKSFKADSQPLRGRERP